MSPDLQTIKDVKAVPMNLIFKDERFNYRGVISPMSVQTLATDIQRNGLESPILIRHLTEEDYDLLGIDRAFVYELVAGFRRYTAHQLLGVPEIPAIIKECDRNRARILNLSENLQRENISYYMEAMAIKDLHERGLSRNQIAEELSLPPGWVQRRTNLLKMPKEIQDMAKAEILGPTHIQELFKFEDQEELLEVARKIRSDYQNGSGEKKAIHIPKPGTHKKDPSNIKKQRKIAEVRNLMNFLRKNNYPDAFLFRCLAWATGELSDLELLVDFQVELKEVLGIDFQIPRGGIPETEV